MASRRNPPLPERPRLSPQQMRVAIARLQRRIEELEAFDPAKVQKRFNIPEVTKLQTAIDEALSSAFGHGTVEYNRYSSAATLDHGPVRMGGDPFSHYDPDNAHEGRQYLGEGKAESLALLRRAVATLEEDLADHGDNAPAAPKSQAPSDQIFVVHGHDEAASGEVARFLEQLGLQPIILKEQPDQGRTIIEKFEAYAGQTGFAVVLLTPDDLVIGGSSEQTSRARQNVIFELGFFVGKLGRGRACLLRKGSVEIPSDLYGVIYTDMDVGGGWKLKLVQELKAAGVKVDANRIWQ